MKRQHWINQVGILKQLQAQRPIYGYKNTEQEEAHWKAWEIINKERKAAYYLYLISSEFKHKTGTGSPLTVPCGQRWS